jgi:response regulator of citrate/malate metabolism
VQYLLKPFTFASLRQKLERYAEFRVKLDGAGEAHGQGEVDRALAALRGVDVDALPPGVLAETMEAVEKTLRGATHGLSASEVANSCGMSRVTARRYLEYLAESGSVRREPRYGGPGRPEMEYRLPQPR